MIQRKPDTAQLRKAVESQLEAMTPNEIWLYLCNNTKLLSVVEHDNAIMHATAIAFKEGVEFTIRHAMG